MVLFILLFLLPSVSALSITELSYDPLGADTDLEWVEIYNDANTSITLQGVKFFEDGVNHNIVAVQGDLILDPFEYAVIAEDPLAFLAEFSYGGTLLDSTFSLSNTGETIVLKNTTVIFDNLTYTYIQGGSENGFSLGLHNGDWKETLPTLGKANTVSDICDWKVSHVSNLVFESSTAFAWKILVEKIKGEPSTIVIQRTVYDIYGAVVKQYDDLTHTITQKETISLDPNLKPGTYLIKTNIIPQCNDSNPINNEAQTLVAIQEERKEDDSSVEVKNILDLGKDKKAKFGQLIRTTIVAYRGDTTKKDISVYIQGKDKLTKILKFSIPEKFTEQQFIIPLQILPNCKHSFPDGSYDLVVEGFGEKHSKKIEISNITEEFCTEVVAKETKKKEPVQKETVAAKEKDLDMAEIKPTTQIPRSAQPDFTLSTVVFESSQRKSEVFMPYGFAVLMTIAFFAVLTTKDGV
ncbi:MAG TPA: lamin tail domain-containing protein [Candidatus Nanoarchaeia archaeon]|nr:lamin tail domain-containing protein [Candidatus Nanoarchaeia archaeon]